MARAPRTSAASYATYKQRAWDYLSQPAHAGMNVGQKARRLYRRCYVPTLDHAVAPKTPLQGVPLLAAMRDLCRAAFNGEPDRRVRVQRSGAPWLRLSPNEQAEYQHWLDYLAHSSITRALLCCIYPAPDELSDTARRAMHGYIHIYGADGRHEHNNWRIGFNIEPQDVPRAVGAVCPILDVHGDIGHFKVSAPGTASKPDSVIVYMRKRAATYDTIKQDLQNALQDLRFQDTFAPMWNEFALGMGEGAEPPRATWSGPPRKFAGSSFGTYRAILTAMAFDEAVANTPGGLTNVTQQIFENHVDMVFARYGVPIADPHEQNPISPSFTAGAVQTQDFMRAFAEQKRMGANTFTNRHAVLRDR